MTYDLRTLLIEAQRDTFVIPRFQREFVWQTAQIKLLVDSVSRNYPIGSLLFLEETNTQDPFLVARPVQAELCDDSLGNSPGLGIDTASKRYYVLDGQQRLTSLVRVFLQASPRVNFYFDLKELFSPEKSPGEWVITRKKSQPMSRRFLRPDIVSDSEKCEVLVGEYFESHEPSLEGDRNAQRKASARVNRIFETIRNYQIPIVIIDRSESLEAICRIFETINSTGTRLTTFDLAVARFFPTPDLHNLLNEAREQYEILSRYSVEGERILQVIAASIHMERGAYPEITRSAVLNLAKQEIETRWPEAVANMAKAYDWVEEHGATPGMLANENLLVPLALFLGIATEHWKKANPGCMATLERWYFSSSLQQGARQASNYRAAQNISELGRWVQHGVLPEIPAVVLTVEKLIELRKADNRYGAIHALLRCRCRTDLWTDEIVATNDVEDHHIFPAALHRRENLNKRYLDSIANRLLVSTGTNRSLGDQLPRDYMGKLYRVAQSAGTLSRRMTTFRDTCIPTFDSEDDFSRQFDPKSFDSFIHARANLILDAVAEVVGESLRRESPIDQDEEDQ